MCEHINRLLKTLGDVKKIENWADKSIFLAQLRMCKVFYDIWFLGRGCENKSLTTESEARPERDPYGLSLKPPKSTTKPRRVHEMKRIFKLIEIAKLMEVVEGRKLASFDLRSFVSKLTSPLKVPSKNGDDANNADQQSSETEVNNLGS
jgi:hypothetical protein